VFHRHDATATRSLLTLAFTQRFEDLTATQRGSTLWRWSARPWSPPCSPRRSPTIGCCFANGRKAEPVQAGDLLAVGGLVPLIADVVLGLERAVVLGTVAWLERPPSSETVGMRSRHLHRVPAAESAFTGFRFPPDVIVLAVSWYLRFGLSYRDVEELLAERGIEVDHVTVYRWVVRFTPLLAEAARPCRHAVGDRWFVDETDVKVAGRWRYADRAIDQFGQVIDVFVSARRDIMAAHRFFERAIGTTKVTPVEIVTDQAATYPTVLDELLPAAWHRADRYANNRVEADHGRLKSRLRPMRGLTGLWALD